MSSPGQVFITSVVILANLRLVEPHKGNRRVVFDANIPVEDGIGNKSTLGLLHYFTPDDRVNDSELRKMWNSNAKFEAFITAKIAAMPKSLARPDVSPELIEGDYAFVGDITEIILTEDANHDRNPYIIAFGSHKKFIPVFLLSP